MKKELSVQEFASMVGQEIGTSSWFHVTQELINQFADVTHDWQFIHIDPVRAKAETPFGGTIAHGFLTVSLLSKFAYEVLPAIENTTASINYGFDKLRFISPVHAGKKIRARFVLKEFTQKSPKDITTKTEVTVEIEGATKPALIAEWIGMRVLG
jgi:acyl dehydratase